MSDKNYDSECSVCHSYVPTKAYGFRLHEPEGEGDECLGAGHVMPLADPRTWHLCYVCATTHISSSNKEKNKTENMILGGIANILLDAIITGKDPREEWGDNVEA